MITFSVGLLILFIGGFLYSKFVVDVFKPDDRLTPAKTKEDGVDYVPMGKWRNALINLLNIAGTGPIFGPIQGILFGPIAFITIPIGCVISGAVHDYFSGMISVREGGIQMPAILRKYLGEGAYRFYNVFLCILLILIGTVFTYTPGDLITGEIFHMESISLLTWVIYGLILSYYLIATIFPIDKIIGKVYPIFGGILLLSSIGVLIGIITKGYQLIEIDFSHGLDGIFNLYPLFPVEGNSGVGIRFIPVFFVTVACGITSGFHSSQCTLIGRTLNHEKDGRMIFYGMMIMEGFVAMIWAAAAMGLYSAGSTVPATEVVGDVAKDLLGPIGGTLAILGVIILPISSGDTSLRACRLIIAERFQLDQKKIRNRLMITLALFIPVISMLVFAKLSESGFSILWRYFSWSNQVITVLTFGAITVYLMNRQNKYKYAYLMTLLPGCFYMFIVTSFILSSKIGFRLPITIAYIFGAIGSFIYLYLILLAGRIYKNRNMEL